MMRLSDKLDNKRLGLFMIEKEVGQNTKLLKLPVTIKNYTVFHISLLEPYIER